MARSRRNPSSGDVSTYISILSCLRALQWKAWTLHWQSAGPQYYGDHLLLQRLYQGEGGGPDIAASIDGLGERMVAYFGPNTVEPVRITAESSQLLSNVKEGLTGLMELELILQKLLKKAWKSNQDSGEDFSLGMDDFIMALANERDTAIYLLKQRLR